MKIEIWDKVLEKFADRIELINFDTNEVKIAYFNEIAGQEVHPSTYYRNMDEISLKINNADVFLSAKKSDSDDYCLIQEIYYQDIIAAFTRKTFPDSDCHSKMHHLEEEFFELQRAIRSFPNEEAIAEEIADCMILLFDIADYFHIDALESVQKKMEVNLHRKWEKSSENNNIYHHIQKDKIMKNNISPLTTLLHCYRAKVLIMEELSNNPNQNTIKIKVLKEISLLLDEVISLCEEDGLPKNQQKQEAVGV